MPRRVIDPLQIIDRDQHRTGIRQVRAQPVEPMQRCRLIREGIGVSHPHRACPEGSSPDKQSPPPRLPDAAQRRLKQLARHAERDAPLKLVAPARITRKPRSAPRPARLRSDAVLPIPAAPWMTTTAPRPSHARGQMFKVLELHLALQQRNRRPCSPAQDLNHLSQAQAIGAGRALSRWVSSLARSSSIESEEEGWSACSSCPRFAERLSSRVGDHGDWRRTGSAGACDRCPSQVGISTGGS